MKTQLWLLIGAGLFWFEQGSAQSFSLDWSSMDGGGGTSAGSVFTLSGCVGQPDPAQTLAGGSFALTGGFWAAVQTSGGPLLTIRRTNFNRLVISWPSSANGFVLQETTALVPPHWLTPAQAVTDDGMNKQIIVDPPAGNRFYRLSQP